MKEKGMLLLVGLMSVLAMHTAVDAKEPNSIVWQKDLKEAARIAKETGRPMVIFVTMNGCGYCTQMKQNTFQDSGLIQELNENYVPTYVDQAQNQKFIQRLKIRSFPTTLLATPDGLIRETVSGYLGVASMRRHMDDISELKEELELE